MATAVINFNTNASHQVVAGVSGKTIIVLSYLLVSAGIVNVTWKSGTTALSGAIPLVANSIVPAAGSVWGPLGWQGILACNSGDDLNLALDAGTLVVGHLSYVQI